MHPGRLVGRDSELSAIDAVLSTLPSDQTTVVALSGEPGIGKTALLGAVIERSRLLGYRVLRGQASELEHDLPFALFAQALEGDVAALAPARLKQLVERDLALLSTVFPALACAAGQTPPALPDDRHRLLHAMHTLLSLLASERPLVLALDDLHWADPASIDLLCRLLHRGLGERSLVLGASRPGQSQPRLKAAFAEAERRGALMIELSALTADASRELVGAEISADVADTLYRHSGGNPLYLRHLAAAARRGTPLPAQEDPTLASSVPPGVSVAINDELRRLSEPQGRLLQGAAIVGDPFDIDLAAQAAAASREASLADLDALLACMLVFQTDSPRRYRFRHPIVRDAVYESAGSGWRTDAHRRLAEALAQNGAPASALAVHVERSARAGDGAATAILAEAGQELMWRSPASAARWFGAALRLTNERDRHREHRLALSAQRAAALGLNGQIAEGRDELYRFLSLAPPEPTELRVQMAVLCAAFGELLGRPDEARTLLLAELARLPDKRSSHAAQLKRELACACWSETDLTSTRRFARQALAADCEGIVRVGALAMLALAELGLGNLARAQRAADEAAALIDRLSDEEIAGRAVAIAVYLAGAEAGMERFERAIAHSQRARSLARAAGLRHLLVHLAVTHSFALASMGRVAELAALNDEMFEEALLSPSRLFLSFAMTGRSFAFMMAGDLFAALSYAERGVAMAASIPNQLTMIAYLQLATVLMELREVERSLHALAGLAGDPELPPFPPSTQAAARELAVRGHIARGDLELAEECARRALIGAKRLGLGVPLALALRARALVLLERGDAKEAISDALASHDAAAGAGSAVEAACSQIVAGKAIAACGDLQTAVAVLKEAYTTLRDCGAVRYSDHAAKELRKLGRAVARNGPRTDAPSILGLSGRERQVMELVAAGRTNRQVADDLYLSRRTVDRHLARIYEKLGVHSRAAAASAFERARSSWPSAGRPS